MLSDCLFLGQIPLRYPGRRPDRRPGFRLGFRQVRAVCDQLAISSRLFMAAPCNRGAIIFLPCDFYLSSVFFFFFSSPNLSGHRLDLYHTSTHGVSLVRISNAGLKCAARGSLQIRDAKVAKNRHLGTIAQLCRAISSQLRHVSTIGKKLVKQQYLLYMFL